MIFELDWLKRWNQYAPNRVILRDPKQGLNLTYSDLYRLSNAVAHEMRTRGIERGDRVAVLAKNSWFYVALLFGAQRCGAILVPINHRLTRPEVDHVVGDASPKLALVDADLLDRISPTTQIIDMKIFQEMVTSHRSIPTIEFSSDPEEASMILYTSGTTGKPKGAIINHRMLFWNSVNTILRLDLSESDVQPSFAPFFHTGGWNVLLLPYLLRGAKTILMDKFEPKEVLRLIESEKLTMFFGVPTMLDLMAQTPNFAEAKLSSLRYVVVGGEPMPIDLIQKWETKGVAIRQGYGLTEFGPNVFSLAEADSTRKIGSIGFPNMFVQTRIVDSENRDVPRGTVGELWLRGPVATPGYWKNETATKELFHDGWLKTGDLVRQDSDGYFYVSGRKKDMYISGGENVYPAEIEQALRSHPNVLEAAVIGVADPKWGESGKAFVVRNGNLTETDVIEHCQTLLAKFKVPKSVVFLDSLPKSDSGKILKRDLPL